MPRMTRWDERWLVAWRQLLFPPALSADRTSVTTGCSDGGVDVRPAVHNPQSLWQPSASGFQTHPPDRIIPDTLRPRRRDQWCRLLQGKSTIQPSISALSTSTSNSAITPSTTPRLSINPLTETRSIRLVVAMYVIFNTVVDSSGSCFCLFSCGSDGASTAGATRVKVRRTRGDSSASTSKARRAHDARRLVGKGREIVLNQELSISWSIRVLCLGPISGWG
jgi:hypothetical protein